MKKFLVLLLALLMLTALCACGETEQAAEDVKAAEAPAEAAATDATDATDGDAEPAVLDDSDGDVYVLTDDILAADEAAANGLDEEMYAAAVDCIGESYETLIEAVGEPENTNYAASCLEMDSEDGQLFYYGYGFYVWTLKTADGETVQDVYPF